ncbi:hypothetical protein [Methanobrevibacter sp.]
MTLSNEELMLTLIAKQNATDEFRKIDQSARSMSSTVCSVLSSMNDSMTSFGQIAGNVVQGLTGKSALDNILGTSSKAETNKVLVKNMTSTEEAYNSLYDTIDKVTDSSLTSMQELIPAMNAFKAATGASDKAMESITDDMANFGAAVLAQTGSTDLAQGAMMDLSKGIKGAFASLDQYGVSEDALKRTKLWSGKEDDVEGYMAAVTKVIGSTDELMETNEGLDAQIGKSFSRAGKKIGNEILPQLKELKKGYIALDNELGGGISASILMVSAGLDTANKAFWNFSTAVKGVRDLKDTVSKLNDALRGTKEAAEMANNALDMGSNISQIGADVSGATSSAGVVEDIALSGGLDIADSIKDTKKQKKEAKKLFDERGKLLAEIHNFDKSKDSEEFKKLQRKLSKVDVKLDKNFDGNPIELIKNKTKKELKPEEISNLFSLNENTLEKGLEEVKKQDWGLTDAIKDNIRNQKSKIDTAIESLKSFVNEGFGTKLQNALKSASGAPMKIKESIGSFGKKLGDIKADGIGGNFKKIDKSLYGFINGSSKTEKILEDAVDIGDEVTDAAKNLKNTKNIADATEGITEGAKAMSAAGPAMEAGSAGAEAAAAGSAGLAASFTSMIVPLLAISAVIIIMIPIVTVIAAEALIFIRLLADFMEALNFDSINLDGAIKGISQVATALAWVGVAMAAMTFTSIMTGLAVITGGFLGILGPLDIAVDAIKKAGEKLSQFTSVQINPNVATNIKSVSDSLMSVSQAMGALTWTNISTGFSNFIAGALGFGSVTDGLEQAKNDIIQASQKLQEFSSLTPLDEGVANNIQNVCDSLASVGSAMDALRSIRDGQNWDDLIGSFIGGIFGEGVDIQTALDNVKDDITKASMSLQGFTGLAEIPDGVSDKIKKVSEVLSSVSEAFETLRGFRDNNIWDDMLGGIFGEGADIVASLDNIKKELYYATNSLKGLEGLPAIGEGIPEKIKTITDVLTELANVTTGLMNIPPMEDFDSSRITTAVSNVQTAADSLKNLNIGEINEETITNIKNVASALTEISGVMNNLTALPPMEGFDSSQITTAVTNVQTAATELSKLSDITMGEDVNGILGSINTALQTLKDTLANAGGFSEVSVNIGSQIVSGVQSGLSPLSSTVTTAVGSATSSAASKGWTGGAHIGQSTTNGFKSALKLADVMTTEMGHVKSAVDSGVSAAKTAAENGAKEVVEAFKNGINVGSPGDIARTMSGEMRYTWEAITSSYNALKKASYIAAKNIVDSFGSPSLGASFTDSPFTFERLNALETTVNKTPDKTDNRPVTIIVGEGAVSVDARNYTTKEAQKLMITAFEGMDNITNVDVGV